MHTGLLLVQQQQQAEKLVASISAENLSLFYIQIPVDSGLTRT